MRPPWWAVVALGVLVAAAVIVSILLPDPAPPGCVTDAYETLRDRLDQYSQSFDRSLLRDLPRCGR